MQNAYEGTYFTVSCAIERGSQPLFFQWLKNGQSINKQSDDLQITLLNDMQTILKYQKSNIKRFGELHLRSEKCFW